MRILNKIGFIRKGSPNMDADIHLYVVIKIALQNKIELIFYGGRRGRIWRLNKK